ncbi:MAG: ribose 5-phosphate isomerase B [Acholeplasmataceae bacterium]
MKVAIGSDHAGFHLKEYIKIYLENKGIKVTDFGTHSVDSVDYPDFAKKVAKDVLKDETDFGILICGTGIGVSIAANKVKGIRAALIYNDETAYLSKAHNNANVIAMGGRTTTNEQAIQMIETYMKTAFEDRHQKRLDKIYQIEGEA